ncbi:MAG: hypothetical protein LBB63_03305 [Holosporaceae bacterium]|jgi:hypothetical protein|nr:hypothetical protein [Holosporaceae bacterium]
MSGSLMTISAMSSVDNIVSKKDSMLGELFAAKGSVSLEEISVSVEEGMNNSGALKVHVVIVYEEHLVEELRKMSSSMYFRMVDQLVKDYPDKMKIFEWELVAKKRLIPPTKVEYPNDHMTPLAVYAFADYSSPGEHRVRIANYYEKVKITLDREDFKILQRK